MSLKLTNTYYKIKAVAAFHKIIQGGQGAGKNWGIETILLEKALEKKRIITIVTDTFENLKDGAIQDYKNMFSNCGLNFDDYYNKQEKNLTWGQSTIQFRYVAAHKQQAGKSKRRNILYINETSKISYKAAQHYIARTSEEIYYDLNPDIETWVHTKIEPKSNAEKIIVTWRDNEMIPAAERNYIEDRRYDSDGNETMWYRVYGRGETGYIHEGLIYKFKIIKEIPETAKRLPSGMDFGTSPDPCVLMNLYLDGTNIYLDEVFVETGLMSKKVKGAEAMSVLDRVQETDHPKEWPIVGDSSGLQEITDLQNAGYYIMPIKKKPLTGIIDGIKLLRSYNIFVTSRSKHTIKGLESWTWKENAKGGYDQEPKGHEPDTLAAARYAMQGAQALNEL